MDSTTEVVLKRLEETQHDFWNIARSTGNFLNMLIKMVNAKNVVEVGTSNGYSGLWIADALKVANNDGHLWTIEFYEKRLNIIMKEGELPSELQGRFSYVLQILQMSRTSLDN